jgi:hypothetical protein
MGSDEFGPHSESQPYLLTVVCRGQHGSNLVRLGLLASRVVFILIDLRSLSVRSVKLLKSTLSCTRDNRVGRRKRLPHLPQPIAREQEGSGGPKAASAG